MGVAFAASMSSGVPAVRSFTSRWRPGVVIVVAAWMLDPAACAGMELGAPRVAVSALAELHQLLTERGFRRSSRDDPIVQEEQYEELACVDSAIREPVPAQHSIQFRQEFAG